jgi:FdhE protein
MMPLDLREEWSDLLARRADLAGALALYGAVVERWAGLGHRLPPLAWTAVECRDRWRRGLPLLAEARPDLAPAALEEVLGPVMDALAALRPEMAPALGRFARAWDEGALGPASLLPARGRIGTAPEEPAIEPALLAFLATVGLRPFLDPYLAGCREHLDDGRWSLGICPFCGAPPGFSEVQEDGRRRLDCHLCGGDWIFSRMRCPYCGSEDSREFARLLPERQDEGYAVNACRRCQGYLKELDRRVRWNGRSGLVEDWGSPHLDLVARRAGYWRGVPSLLDLLEPTR